MPSIELKTLDRINPNDILLVNADQLIKAGKPIAEGMIKRLAQHKVMYLPILNFTYEEREQLSINNDDQQILQLLGSEVEKRQTKIEILRGRLLEKTKSMYVPYDENNPCFSVKGKKKQVTKNILLESEPGPLYQPDIDAGSEAIIQSNFLRYLIEILKTLYSDIDGLNYLKPDTFRQPNCITRLKLQSIRMQSIYENSRLSNVGTAFPGHAVDCALYFLIAMTNENKIRITKGCPLSTERFDPEKSSTKGERYHYRPGMIVDTALGVILHAMGYSHTTIHSIASVKHLLRGEDLETVKRRRTLQRNNFVIRNMLRNRKDLSSLAKMIVSLQYEFPDGTGFPPLNENKTLHEFVRLFQVIDFYDEMTNPSVAGYLFSRWDVIRYLQTHSGNYLHIAGQFVKNQRFDKNMTRAFLQILAPYDVGEKVYLYPKDDRSTFYFVGRVHSYLDSHIPLISVLQDKRSGKNYRDGSLLFYIPQSIAFYMQNNKIVKKVKMDWICKLEIFDYNLNPASIAEYKDELYGAERKLAKRIKSNVRDNQGTAAEETGV